MPSKHENRDRQTNNTEGNIICIYTEAMSSKYFIWGPLLNYLVTFMAPDNHNVDYICSENNLSGSA